MLEEQIDKIAGIKKERKELLNKMGIYTINDILRHYPRAYEDRRKIKKIIELIDGKKELIKAKVLSKPSYRYVRSNLNIVKVMAYDESGKIEITYFNQKYMLNNLKENEEYLFFGKVQREFNKVVMVNPLTEVNERHTGAIMPIYTLKKNMSAKVFTNIVKLCIEMLSGSEEETLPSYIKQKYELCDILFAYKNIHFPANDFAIEIAKRRLIFEELLFLQIGLLKLKSVNKSNTGISFKNFKIVEELAKIIPFELTGAQKRVIREIAADIKNKKQLNRLVQGDVGSGKTIVACAALLMAANCGYQGALMAPTEILAVQHYEEIVKYFDYFNIKCALLTGSTSKKEKARILEGLKSGDIKILIGTHAIIEKDVVFSDLALCVTDEQHRFGVKQRNLLYEKGNSPHILVMSATPIPRTLALILYSDLDISIIDEMPPLRKKVDTILASEKDRDKIDDFLRKELEKNNQIYVVCPLVETKNPDSDLKSAVEYSEILANKFPEFKTGLLHGKMKSSEKDEIMLKFKNHEIDILISTTVIEVGVNVKNATVMLIENAERFGLSQLHQLRGRVGRGEKKSYNILVSDLNSKTTKERLKIMVETNDGFKISEKDLELRGPGDFFGTEQSGFLDLKIADLLTDIKMLHLASNEAKSILKEDEDLNLQKNRLLKKNVNKMFLKNGIKIFN